MCTQYVRLWGEPDYALYFPDGSRSIWTPGALSLTALR